jgi:hypothetical protein
MRLFKILAIIQVYNELEKGNLQRFFRYIKNCVDEVVVYDDCSTDGSYEYAKKNTQWVLRGLKNDFTSEIKHKQILLETALSLKPDFILSLDADEVISKGGNNSLQTLCKLCIEKDLDGLEFQLINLWRSTNWKRLDSLYNEGWQLRLWRVKSNMSFDVSKLGLHQKNFPESVKKTYKQNDLKIIHYGFSDDINLAHKYLTYKKHGQRGYDMLDRLIDENQLILEEVSSSLFPVGLYHNSPKPNKRSFVEALEVIESLKCKVKRPKYSIACLIYKSIEWLDFVYKQLLKYTDLKDVEFYFVANDASENVIKYLKNNHIPHYIHQNYKINKDEWYINNVYKAYNYAVQVAKGDFVVLINSDMCFSPGWLDALIAAYDGNNVISSRLVEPGKLPSGLHGIEKNFGKDISDYKEKKFLTFANSISKKKIVEGGLYMPFLFRKDHFIKVNGYPEGNLKKNADIFSNDIASRNEEQLPGDKVLIQKLKTIGVKHVTALNSIVYHFQNGEQDSKDKIITNTYLKNIAVCGDLSLKTFENKILAHYLVGNIPNTYLIDAKLIINNNSKEKINKIIKNNYPKTSIIIKNATSSNFINPELYTICFIEDDLRKAGKRNVIQEINLKYCDKRVTNSIEIAISYAEYDFEIIPNLSLEKWKKLIEKSSIEAAQLQTRIIKPVISSEDFLLIYEKLSLKFQNLLIDYLLGEKYWVIKKLFTKEGIKYFTKRVLVSIGLLKYIKIFINTIKRHFNINILTIITFNLNS